MRQVCVCVSACLQAFVVFHYIQRRKRCRGTTRSVDASASLSTCPALWWHTSGSKECCWLRKTAVPASDTWKILLLLVVLSLFLKRVGLFPGYRGSLRALKVKSVALTLCLTRCVNKNSSRPRTLLFHLFQSASFQSAHLVVYFLWQLRPPPPIPVNCKSFHTILA